MTPLELPQPGAVIDYPYLWVRERDVGETEGRKTRPTCVVVSLSSAFGEHLVALLAITSQSPRDLGAAVEVPALELRRAGLAGHRRAWVITDEFNTDILERSWYYAPNLRRGAFSQAFLGQILKAFRPTLARRGGGSAGLRRRVSYCGADSNGESARAALGGARELMMSDPAKSWGNTYDVGAYSRINSSIAGRSIRKGQTKPFQARAGWANAALRGSSQGS